MENILVIEDEVELLEEIVEWLQFEGYKVYKAGGGGEGIRLAQAHAPDLIICDIMMPYIDGYRVLLELRTKPATALTPFIFLSALADRRDIRRGMSLGADDYLTKPFVRTDLLDAVRSRLDKHAENKRRMAAALDELRIGMSVTLPHELRTPLTGIIGFGELLALDPGSFTPDEIGEMATVIVNSGERLLRLVDNYLLYVQLELTRGKATTPDDDGCNPHSIVSGVALRLAQKYARESDLAMALTDANVAIASDMLHKLVHELLDNAFKFSRVGTPITVSCKQDDGDWVLYVGDRGRGIAPEDVQRIDAHTQFMRKTYEQQGSGLGLAIASRLAERYHGELRIDSQLNVGTDVYVRLPLLRV
jgi:two-component system sensor histidine kinase/response regulator